MVQTFNTLPEAQAHLSARGLALSHEAPHDHGPREYWSFIEGEDALLDHSATITPLGSSFGVSTFGRAAFAHIEKPEAGSLTAEITAGSFKVEVKREEVEAAVSYALRTLKAKQVEVISWVHRHNNPGCLPAVVANTSGLSVWTLDEEGELSERGINIWG